MGRQVEEMIRAEPLLQAHDTAVFAVGLFLGIIFGTCATIVLHLYAQRKQRERGGEDAELLED